MFNGGHSIMKTNHYFPQNELDRCFALNKYSNSLSKYGPILGVSGEEITSTQNDISSYVWYSQTWYPPIQQLALAASEFRTLLALGTGAIPEQAPALAIPPNAPSPCAPGLLNRISNQIKRIKLSSAYTEGIGQDMDIVPNVTTTEHATPQFTAQVEQSPTGNQVRLDYRRFGHAGVAIEKRVNGGLWQFFGHFTQKSAHDDHELSVEGTVENREYRMRWWDKDESHGDWSTTQAVYVGK
jgi:hypothetical protein